MSTFNTMLTAYVRVSHNWRRQENARSANNLQPADLSRFRDDETVDKWRANYALISPMSGCHSDPLKDRLLNVRYKLQLFVKSARDTLLFDSAAPR